VDRDCAFLTAGPVASLDDYLLFQREMTRTDCASWLWVHAEVMPGRAHHFLLELEIVVQARYRARGQNRTILSTQPSFNRIIPIDRKGVATTVSIRRTDTTYGLADYYGFKTGELVTDDQRNVSEQRIDGPDELNWPLTLGAVVCTEGGESLRKGNTQF
jgi:hypothetical protein